MESTNKRTAMSIFVYSVYGAIGRLPVIVQSEERELLRRKFLKEKLTQLFSQKLWVISEHCRYLSLPYMPHWRLHFVFQARWLAARRCRRWRAASAWCPSTAAARRGCTSARTPSPAPISGPRPPSSPTLESAQVSDWHAHAESCDPELKRRPGHTRSYTAGTECPSMELREGDYHLSPIDPAARPLILP